MGKAKTHEQFVKEVYDLVGDEYIVLTEYINAFEKIKIIHNIERCKHEYYVSPNNFLKGRRCPVCITSPKTIKIGVNDMWTTNLKLAKLLNNPEDGYKYTQNSGKSVDWKCPECKYVIKDKTINDVNRKGLSCMYCSDGISYPEKFMINCLNQLKLNFIYQKKFDWSNNKTYDFYLCDFDCIIEVHGMQHYTGKMFIGKNAVNIDNIFINDNQKRKMALKNVCHYIEIDARYSTSMWMKKSILNSRLFCIAELSTYNIDWLLCNEKSLKSYKNIIYSYWNNGITDLHQIAQLTNLSVTTIRRYLKQGAANNMCNYGSDESIQLKRKVHCQKI